MDCLIHLDSILINNIIFPYFILKLTLNLWILSRSASATACCLCACVCVCAHLSSRVTKQHEAGLRWQSDGIRGVRPGLGLNLFYHSRDRQTLTGPHLAVLYFKVYQQSVHTLACVFQFHRHCYLICELWVSHWAAALQLVEIQCLAHGHLVGRPIIYLDFVTLEHVLIASPTLSLCSCSCIEQTSRTPSEANPI